MNDNIDYRITPTAILSDMEETPVPVLAEEEEILEMNNEFNMEEFQVVRREFFAHMHEPSITFKDRKVYVNTACLTKFPSTDYVQALINPKSKILALRPCHENTRGAFLWCTTHKGKRKPKENTCTLFFAMLFTMMNWDPENRYKLLGSVIHANGEYLIAFDLTSTEVYQRNHDSNNTGKRSKTPAYPAGWQNQFGLPFYEHRQSMLINIFDGYAVYSIKDNKTIQKTSSEQALADVSSFHSIDQKNQI